MTCGSVPDGVISLEVDGVHSLPYTLIIAGGPEWPSQDNRRQHCRQVANGDDVHRFLAGKRYAPKLLYL